MAKGIIDLIKESYTKKNNSHSTINKKVDNILMLKEPQIYTMAKENNISCKYDNFLITKDGNISMAVELKGTSYAGISLDDETDYLLNRVMFFTTLKDDVEINIIIDKKKIKEEQSKSIRENINVYAKEVIEKWETNQDIYKIKYYLIISTRTKNITGALESFKTKVTTENNEENNNQTAQIKQKIILLNELYANIKNYLSNYKPSIVESDEFLNFYASYSNANETELSYKNELITDCYISSDVEFKKNYIKFSRNDGSEKYSSFISVKAYETEQIKSIITSNLIKANDEFKVFIYLKPYEKKKALKKIKDTKAFSVELVRQELDELSELIQADRENLVETSFSVYVVADNEKDLEKRLTNLKNILENQGLNVVRETINLKALFFSFFPSRGNLNARKKTLNISNLSTIANFENEVQGYNKNDWGNEAVTTFKHLNATPFLFNFHYQPNGDRPSGHTMIMGGTGSGKTTLAQFLMLNLFKFNIDIFAMDKLRGMHNFTNYMDGNYYDSGIDGLKFNPFSLEDNQENRDFLKSWLISMANIKEDEHQAVKDIQSTLEIILDNKLPDQILTLTDFITSLPAENEEKSKLRIRFENYQNSIFDNIEDALTFDKQLSVVNMDGILTDKKKAGLTAMYIFHRLKIQAKNNKNKRGFFCFIDELKDYLNDETMQEKILEAILEVRKIGGVMCMGFQSISLFNQIERGSSFLDNIANFIIYPTSNDETLGQLAETISLTPTELKFLKETNMNARQVLLNMKLRNETAKLDVDLSKLGKFLRIFSSSSDEVMLMNKLKQEQPKHWRFNYLENKEKKEI